MNKKAMLALLCCLLVALAGKSQEKKIGCYAVAFYNLENLFDTIHDEGKNDYEYLPNGANHWDSRKYLSKLKNLSKVIAEVGTDQLKGIGASVIGVSEVENARALTDLVNQPLLKERGMQFVHIEGPDRRGVDCALLYNPRFFTPEKSFLQPYVYEPKDSTRRTRGFLTVQGKIAGDDVTFIVCHWPSRFATSHYREMAGEQVRHLKDSILAACPDMKIMVMGDMNDDPTDKSMAQALGAKRELEKVKDGEMFNPWWNILKTTGKGTLTYQGGWNLFDQIVLSPNMLNKKGVRDYASLKYHKAEVFRRDYLMQTEGKYKGNTKRTHAGGVWLDGYSDHLPVVIYLLKELK
ncbi:MAG: endonuclease/exonuclease/phosphatase family protein [Paraprevotella sp.]|nr:endonuclease/exonuclease/phosphatase family protein [Paraprevotella sp.]